MSTPQCRFACTADPYKVCIEFPNCHNDESDGYLKIHAVIQLHVGSALWHPSRGKRSHCTWLTHVTATLLPTPCPDILGVAALCGMHRRGEGQVAEESKGKIREWLHLGTERARGRGGGGGGYHHLYGQIYLHTCTSRH